MGDDEESNERASNRVCYFIIDYELSWKIYPERKPYFNPRFKFISSPYFILDYINDDNYIVLDFQNPSKPIDPNLILYGGIPISSKSFCKALTTNPKNDLVNDHYGVLSISHEDKTRTYNITASNKLGWIRPNTKQIKAGSYYNDHSKETFLNQLGFQESFSGSFFKGGFNHNITKEPGKHIQSLHPERLPTLKHGIPINELHTLYRKCPSLEKEILEWHNLTLPIDFCKDYPQEFGDLIRVVGYSKGDYTKIVPYMNNALEICDRMIKSYPQNSEGFLYSLKIQKHLLNMDVAMQPMKLKGNPYLISSQYGNQNQGIQFSNEHSNVNSGKSFYDIMKELGVYV